MQIALLNGPPTKLNVCLPQIFDMDVNHDVTLDCIRAIFVSLLENAEGHDAARNNG